MTLAAMSAAITSPGRVPWMHVEQPAWLLLLLLVVPVAWTGLRWLSTMSIARRVFAVVMRAAVIVIVVAMLSGAAMVGPADRLAVVVVADVSGSVAAGGAEEGSSRARVRAMVERLDVGRGPDDLLGVVLFDGRAAPLAMPTSGSLSERSWEMQPRDGTNIEQALRLGAALIPPGADGRVVLATDGNQTAGDAVAAAAELASRSVRVDVVPLMTGGGEEVMVERVDVPVRASAGATITARVHFRSTSETTGTLRVLVNGQPVATGTDGRGDAAGGRQITVRPGVSVHLVEATLGSGRVHTVEAVFEPDGDERRADTVAANNTAQASVLTPGTGAVLIIDGVGGGDRNVSGASIVNPLERAGLRVEMVVPEAAPTDLIGVEPFDLIVLQNVPASAMSERAQNAIASAVRELGVGLVMVGGPLSFGAGGWRASEIEPILPVLLDLPDRIVVPEAAIVLVLDSSGSMRRRVLGSSRSQQEIANEAAALAVRSLDTTDLVGVIHFSDHAKVLVPLAPNTSPDAASEKILGISADGGTDVRSALVEAGRQLRRAEAKVKHIVVLSDGQSQGAEILPEFAAQLAAEGVQVSAIAVGDDADTATMRAMAERGGGVFHNVINPARLPRVFLKVVEVVRSPLVREGRFVPIVTSSGSPLTLGMGQPPDLLGLVLTRERPDARVSLAMTAPTGEPLLAHWPVELGQVAAFTSDASDWASEWLAWDGFAPFWVRIARVIGRAPFASPMELTMTSVEDGSGHHTIIALDAVAPDGTPIDGLEATASVYRQDEGEGAPVDVDLRQTGPGRYEGVASAEPGASYVVLARAREGDRALAPALGVMTAPPGIEHASIATNMGLLERVAAATGGKVLASDAVTPAIAFDRAGLMPSHVLRPLWKPLLPWLLVAVLLDIAVRRIAWDRLISERFGDGLGTRARIATAARGDMSAQALGTLRAARGAQRASEVAVLTEQDAERVRRQQAIRRQAAQVAEARRRAGYAVDPLDGASAGRETKERPPTVEAAGGEGGHEGESSLLAAKRRARERLDRESRGDA